VRSDDDVRAEYAGDAEKTRAAFTADGFYRTGDLASYGRRRAAATR
jgi:long-subunit acyl-CoA synthetase (AMP-forming)